MNKLSKIKVPIFIWWVYKNFNQLVVIFFLIFFAAQIIRAFIQK